MRKVLALMFLITLFCLPNVALSQSPYNPSHDTVSIGGYAYSGTPASGDVLYFDGTNWLSLTKCTNGYPYISDGSKPVCGSASLKTWPATASVGICNDGSGNPIACTISENATLGTVELGHASDTTLARVSAGVMSIENINVVTVSATQTLTNKSITAVEVDGHATGDLSAANVSGTVVYNTGQGAADVHLHLPAAAAGYNALFTVGTAQANHWGVCAAANNKIYLVAAAGTVVAGDDAACVVMTAAEVGQSFACFTFKTDDYDWQCKAISIGTSTFAAHAAF